MFVGLKFAYSLITGCCPNFRDLAMGKTQRDARLGPHRHRKPSSALPKFLKRRLVRREDGKALRQGAFLSLWLGC